MSPEQPIVIDEKTPDRFHRIPREFIRSARHDDLAWFASDRFVRSGSSTRHLAALIGAITASLSTFLTVVGFVLFAFLGTCIANRCAQPARLLSELRSTAHEGGCGPAGLGAIAISANAFGHFFDIRFAQAGVSTMFARLGTFNAGFDTGTIFFVRHLSPPQ